MILNNLQIINLYDAILKLYNDENCTFNIKTSFLLAKNKIEIERLNSIIQEERRKIYLQLGTQDDEGNIVVPNEKGEELAKKVSELYDIENEANLSLINVDDLNGRITIKEAEKLLPIIQE